MVSSDRVMQVIEMTATLPPCRPPHTLHAASMFSSFLRVTKCDINDNAAKSGFGRDCSKRLFVLPSSSLSWQGILKSPGHVYKQFTGFKKKSTPIVNRIRMHADTNPVCEVLSHEEFTIRMSSKKGVPHVKRSRERSYRCVQFSRCGTLRIERPGVGVLGCSGLRDKSWGHSRELSCKSPAKRICRPAP